MADDCSHKLFLSRGHSDWFRAQTRGGTWWANAALLRFTIFTSRCTKQNRMSTIVLRYRLCLRFQRPASEAWRTWPHGWVCWKRRSPSVCMSGSGSLSACVEETHALLPRCWPWWWPLSFRVPLSPLCLSPLFPFLMIHNYSFYCT